MTTIRTIAVHELRTMYRRRVFQVITLGVPLLAVAGLVGIWFAINVLADDEVEVEKFGYVDGTGLFNSHLTYGNLKFVAYASRAEGMDALLGGDLKRLYLIRADYLSTGMVQRFEVGHGLNLEPEDDILRAFLVDNLLESAPESDIVTRMRAPLHLDAVVVNKEGVARDLDAPRIFFFVILGAMFVFSLGITGGIMLQGMGEEKESRIMEVLLSSVTPGEFMAGKVLGLSAAGLSQILFWLVSGWLTLQVAPALFSDLDIPLPSLWLVLLALVFFVMGYLMFATLNAGIGAIAPTPRESQQLSIFIAAPLIVALYSSVYIVENPSSAVVKFLTFFPFTAPLVVLERLGPGAIEWWEVAGSLAILSLSAPVAMFLAGRVFRAFLLSYGKRPSLRLLWAAVARR